MLYDPDKTEWLNQNVKQWRGAGYERFVKFVRNVDVYPLKIELNNCLCVSTCLLLYTLAPN